MNQLFKEGPATVMLLPRGGNNLARWPFARRFCLKWQQQLALLLRDVPDQTTVALMSALNRSIQRHGIAQLPKVLPVRKR